MKKNDDTSLSQLISHLWPSPCSPQTPRAIRAVWASSRYTLASDPETLRQVGATGRVLSQVKSRAVKPTGLTFGPHWQLTDQVCPEPLGWQHLPRGLLWVKKEESRGAHFQAHRRRIKVVPFTTFLTTAPVPHWPPCYVFIPSTSFHKAQ